MKYIYTILTLLLTATFTFASNLDKLVFKISNITTTTTCDEVTSQKITGYIERVVIVVSTGGIDADFDVIASNDYSGTEATIYSADDITTNVNAYTRTAIHSTAGVSDTNFVDRIPVYQDNIIFKASDAAATNCDAKAFIYYEKR